MIPTKKLKLTTAILTTFVCNDVLALNLSNHGVNNSSPLVPESSYHNDSPEYKSKVADVVVVDQVSKQINRQISNIITNRITYNINPAFSALTNVGGGAGDERNAFMPDSLWSTFSWSKLNNDGNAIGKFDTNIYQTTSGVDKKIGDFYIGTSLVYAAAVTDFLANNHDTKHTVNITPYAAYVINKNFFLSALSGYLFTNSDSTFAPQSNTHANVSEIDFNALHVIDNWFMKGKVGGRYNHGYTRTDAVAGGKATTDNSDSWTYLTDVSGGYAFENGIKVFTGVLYELSNRGGANLPAGFGTDDNSVFYYNAGIDYSVSKALSLGANVQTDLSNSAVDLTTVGLNMRLAL